MINVVWCWVHCRDDDDDDDEDDFLGRMMKK